MSVLRTLPVVLPASTITFPAGVVANAPVAIAAVQGIRNTESTGVLLDKIVVISSGAATLAGGGPVPVIELRWRDNQITGGFVTLPAVAWPQDRGVEGQRNYAIKLSKPIYLAPGEIIAVSARSDFFPTLGAPVFVSVVGIGRQCDFPPAERWLPYLCDYVGPAYAVGGGAVISDQSVPTDLGNPFGTGLVIERMIGRVLAGLSGAFPLAFRDDEPRAFWNAYQLRISDHRDNFWVANPTALPLVFNTVDRSWMLNHTLESKGFLRVEFEGIANISDLGIVAFTRAVVGVVGYRRIA